MVTGDQILNTSVTLTTKKIYNKKAVTMLLIQNGYFPMGN